MHKTLNVFILAAGLGERLRPITNHIPKPLLPILGRPVLQIVLERVSALPFARIGINLHYKKEAVESWIRQYCASPLFGKGGGGPSNEKIILFHEENIFGTGGALKNAGAFLSGNTFLVHNSDILSDMDLGKILEYHLSSDNLATLAVHGFEKFNNLVVDEKGFLKGIGGKIPLYPPLSKGGMGGSERLAFTGIAVYDPEFFKFLPEGFSSVVDAWLRAVSAGYKVGTFDVSGCFWSDIGTPDAYASSVFDALRTEGETVYIHQSLKNCTDVDLQGYAVIEKDCVFEEAVSLRNCIVLPGSRIQCFPTGRDRPSPTSLPSGTADPQGRIKEGVRGDKLSSYENCIMGPGFKIDLNEPGLLNMQKDGSYLIGTGGSDRRYYRVCSGRGTGVMMQCTDKDPDFERHVEYTRFFLTHHVPVPHMMEAVQNEKRAVFEDLGDLSLYSWLKCRRKRESVEELYRRVLDILVHVHTIDTDSVSQCPLLKERVFDHDHFRWETAYFMERFVAGITATEVEDTDALNGEFHMLARKADSFRKTVIHRDFQSQNIMITTGGIPRVIDYQGARLGPPSYDLASLLWDPYSRLEDDMRERLLGYYMNKMMKCLDPASFIESLLPCRLQRHMQALGAFGFLSTVKGKRYFLKHVPEGVRLLKEDAYLAREDYPALFSLVARL